MKLTIELVPRPCWNKSLSHLHSKGKFPLWEDVRKAVLAACSTRCALCGDKRKKNMHCHEIWEYDDVQNAQSLKTVIGICNMCHHVKHIGLAEILARQGKLNYDKVVEHFCRVNECTKTEFQTHALEAFRIWDERSEKEWATHFGPYNDMVMI